VAVTRTIRVPDPVYRAARDEADQKDVNIGTVIRDWMLAVEKAREVSE
jgi:hypothetical protein